MKKQILYICAAIMLALCLGTTGAMAKKNKGKDKCILLGYDWDRTGEFSYTYLWLYADGTIADQNGIAGYWNKFKNSFMFQSELGCFPLYAGSKTLGFMQCTSGDGLELPGYYKINYVNKKYCEGMVSMPRVTSSLEEAGTCFSPE